MALGGTVSEDALATGQGLADVLAVDTLQTLNQVLIGMDIHQLGAQNFPLPTAGTPTLTPSISGGSIAASTAVYVKVAGRSLVNYYRGGSQTASAERTTTTSTTTSTNSIGGFVVAVKGASAYDWYVGSSSGAEVYYTTTSTNTVTITSIPTVAQKVPTTLAGLYGSFGPNSPLQGPTSVPTADSSYQSYWQNGLLPSIVSDWASVPDQLGAGLAFTNLTTPGGGTTQGAYYSSLDGGQLVLSGAALEQIDVMNKTIYDTYQLSVTRMLMGSQTITDIANALLDNPQAITWLTPTDASGRARMVAGGAVAIYLNKTVNGKPIVLELQPHLPPGTIIAVVDEVPFPGANMVNPLQVETLIDFWRFDYGASRIIGNSNGGPRYDFEIRSIQTFKNLASPVMGVLQNIAPGISS